MKKMFICMLLFFRGQQCNGEGKEVLADFCEVSKAYDRVL